MPVVFTAWGYEVVAAELAAVVLALAGILLGIAGSRWTWPMWFAASVLYAWLFVAWQLYASAGMQFIFMAAAVWGWFSWGPSGVSVPKRLDSGGRIQVAALLALGWLALLPVLAVTGGVSIAADSFMFTGSLTAQLLMVFGFVENWPMWLVVNTVGALLYGSQGLYFTAGFYALLLALAAAGWRTWRRRSEVGPGQRILSHA